MNIYKAAAEYLFVDEKTLVTFFGRIKRDQEFEEYIAALDGVHKDTDAGLSPEESVKKNIEPAHINTLIKIINAIGQQNFIQREISDTAESLRQLRHRILHPEAELETELPQPSEVVQPNLIPQEEIGWLSPEKIMEYFRALESAGSFPENRRAEASEWINLLDQYYQKIKSKELVGLELNKAKRAINDLKSRINLLAHQALEGEQDGEEPEEIAAPVVQERAEEPEEDLPTEEIELESDEDADKESDDARRSVDVDRSQSLNHNIFKDIGSVIDLSVSPPTVSEDDLNKVYANFLQDLDQIHGVVLAQVNSKSTKKLPKKYVTSLNLLMAAIKEFSVKAINLLSDAKTQEADASLVPEYESLIAFLVANIPTQRIKEDLELRKKLFIVTLYLASPQLTRIIFGGSEDDLVRVAKKMKSEQFLDRGDARQIVLEEMSKATQATFENKLDDFLSLNHNASNGNYIRHMALYAPFIFSGVRDSLQGDLIKHTYRHCPTCYKWIMWSPDNKMVEFQPHLKGFRVRLFSFYTGTGKRITEQDLLVDPDYPRRERKFHFPRKDPNNRLDMTEFLAGKNFEKERERAASYIDPKTWRQINELISSNDSAKHEEGWHRRAAVLSGLGGLHIKDIYVRGIMTKCPSGSEGGTSNCGLSYSGIDGVAKLGIHGAQPSWNGIANNNITKDTRQSEIAIDPRVVSKEQAESLRRTQSAGFKFSKMNFACPCHIPKTNADTAFKHNLLVMPMTGPTGTSKDAVYPTAPDGKIDMDFVQNPGTLAFLICGAPTSLSSFDRDASSDGFILKYLRDVVSTSHDDYLELINTLIGDGVDVNTVMALDNYLIDYIEPEITSKAYNFKLRKQEISDLLIKIAAKPGALPQDSQKLRLYEKISLVCPFGHKFTIKQSLDFGAKHIGLQTQGIIAFSKVINSKGFANIKEVLQGSKSMLVPTSDYPDLIGLVYSDWSQLEPEQRSIIPNLDEPDKPVLIFEIPNIDGTIKNYFLRNTYKFRPAWSDSASYESKAKKIETLPHPSAEGAFGRETALEVQRGDAGDAENVNLADLQASRKAFANLEDDEAVFTPALRPIPGSIEPDNSTIGDKKSLDTKIRSLAQTFKCALKIINVWTNMISTSTMASSLVSEYKPNLLGYQKDLTRIVSDAVEVYDEQGERIVSGPLFRKTIEELGVTAAQTLNDKVNNLFPYLIEHAAEMQQQDNLGLEMAHNIAVVAILQAIEKFEPSEGEIDYGDRLETIIDKGVSVLVKNKIFVDDVTYNSPEFHKAFNKRMQYTSQIILVAYAQYLAGALSQVYNKYFKDSNNNFFVGYDLGLDLSTKEKILGHQSGDQWSGGITAADVSGMVDSLEKAGNLPLHRFEPPLHARIDKAYDDLRKSMILASYFTATPKSMNSAKKYLVTKLSNSLDSTSSDTRAKLGMLFPTKTFRFNGTLESPETSTGALPSQRRPFISKQVSIDELPGTRLYQSSHVVLDNLQRFEKELASRVVFNSEQEAKQYIREAEAADPNWRGRLTVWQSNQIKTRFNIEPVPLFVNEEIGYDSNLTQVGIYGDKPLDALEWPPSTLGYTGSKGGFAGLMLPFSLVGSADDGRATATTLSHLMITDYQVTVDVDGEPTDISILFKRGRDDAQVSALIKKENAIIKRTEAIEQEIADYWKEMSRRKKEGEGVANLEEKLAEFRAIKMAEYFESAAPILHDISKIPIRIRAASTYARKEGPKKWSGKPMGLLLLEDPVRCLRIIDHPEIRGVRLNPAEQQALLNFVIQVYGINHIRDLVRELSGDQTISSEQVLRMKPEDMPVVKVSGGKRTVSGMLKKPTWIDTSQPNAPTERLGWVHQPGKYFTVIPSEPESDNGTWLEYLYHTYPKETDILPEGVHPTVNILHSRIDILKGQGLLESDNANALELLSKVQKTMVDYIEKCVTSSTTSEAQEHYKKSNLKTYKISERLKELERTILSVGIVDFDENDWPEY